MTDQTDKAVHQAIRNLLPDDVLAAQRRMAERDRESIDRARMMAEAFNYYGPPREKVLVGVPVMDFKPWSGCVAGLMQCLPFYLQPLILGGCANIGLARNEIVHWFLNRAEFLNCEWFVWIDADIEFTMEDWRYLMEGDEDIVSAEYACKVLGEPPVRSGLGFARIKRSVYERIRSMLTPEGAEQVPRFFHKGAMMVDFHPIGANPMSEYLGEDQAFTRWAKLAGCTWRGETRTRLKHWGAFPFGYPDQIPGMKVVTAAQYAEEVSRAASMSTAQPSSQPEGVPAE